MNPKDVVSCIKGTPRISTAPIDPGLITVCEADNQRLAGINTEIEEMKEGSVRFFIKTPMIHAQYLHMLMGAMIDR